MTITSDAQFLSDVFDFENRFPNCSSIGVEGLRVTLFSETEHQSTWLTDNFSNIDDSTDRPVVESWQVAVVWSDRWIKHALHIVDSNQFTGEVYQRREQMLARFQIANEIVLDYLPSQGVAWLTDSMNSKIAMIHSSRTPLFALELRIGLIDVIHRYLEHRGWHTIHAGCIRVESESGKPTTFVIIGDSGSGKTSLVTHLVAAGGLYISNERLFVKAEGGQVRVRSFPQTIGIGMGTALQHPQLKPLIERPDRLAYYQKAFEPERVWNTPPEHMPELPDKLKLLPTEFTDLFQVGVPLTDSVADRLLIPALVDRPAQHVSVSSMPFDKVFELVTRNYFASESDKLYPRWLPLRYEYHSKIDPAPICNSISQFCCHRFEFSRTSTATQIRSGVSEVLAEI